MGIARRYYLPGADPDDVRQIALEGLLLGIRAYDPAKGPARRFLAWCIEKRVQGAVKAARAQKHRPLTESVRPTVADGGDVLDPADRHRGEETDPAVIVERRETVRRVLDAFSRLSDLERRELLHVVNGGTYKDTPGVRNKSRENAVDRARRKLREAA